MLLAGLDFETTGLSPQEHYITEVGIVLWETTTQTPVIMQDMYLDWPEVTDIDPVVEKLTGITKDTLRTYGLKPQNVFRIMESMFSKADFIVAHNGTAFDKLHYLKFAERMESLPTKKHWIDTQTDIEYPEEIKTRKLTHLAAEHGFLNPFAHRAIFDVLTMLKVLDRYNIAEVIELSQQPTVFLRAHVTYDNRTLASARGYRWSGEKKVWFKAIKQCFVKREREQCGEEFQVSQIDNPEEPRF